MQRSQLRQPQAGPSRAASTSQQPLNKPEEKAKQDDKKKDPKKATDRKNIEFSLPPLSIVGKKKGEHLHLTMLLQNVSFWFRAGL